MEAEEDGVERQNCRLAEDAEVKATKSQSTKFQKVWSEEDEISLLNGYYEYREKKGKYDGSGFYEFIKHRLLRAPVKQQQISDKLCRLKKKYVETASKAEEGNHNRSNGHLQKLFELSKRNWSVDRKDAASKTGTEANVRGPPSPSSPVGAKYEVVPEECVFEDYFVGLLEDEGVDVHLLDDPSLRNLKRAFGEVELAQAKFEYKQAKLRSQVQKLKYDRYKTICSSTTSFDDF